MPEPLFRDRPHAGKVLARLLARFAGTPGLLVLGLPRGGVPVAFEVAQALHAPLDVLVARKLGVPGHPEYAMGAIASGGVRLLNDKVVSLLDIPPQAIEMVIRAEQHELARRERLYRGTLRPPDVHGRTVLVIDDGLATGSTMQAAVKALRQQQPVRICVAVPIAAPDSCQALRAEADDVLCAAMPQPLHAVGLWYQHFEQTSDGEVSGLLARARRDAAHTIPGDS